MRILHVINYYHEGFGYQENCLSFYQKKFGNDVLVATSDYYFPFPDYNNTMKHRLGERYVGSGKFKDNDVDILRLKSFFNSIGSTGIIYFNVSGIVKEFSPDIVHVHGATNFCLPSLVRLKRKYHYKIFVDSHQDSAVSRKNGGLFEKVYYFLWRFYYHILGVRRAIDRFLPITVNAKKWLARRLYLSEQDMELLPLGVDTTKMYYSKEQDQLFRKKYGLEGKTLIVNAGKQYNEKRIDWIIDAVEHCRNIGSDVFLILVGNADVDYNRIIERKLNGIKGFYLRLPFLKREDLRTVYSACDIGVWPGIPSNTIQEAMACKVAMVLPNDEIVGHLIDGNGIAESENFLVVAEYICRVDQDKAMLEKLKSRSEKIAYKYSWETISKDLDKIYVGHKDY